jgi:hypothetical protein
MKKMSVVKTKCLLFIVFVFSIVSVNGQSQKAKFGVGVNTELFSLSLNSDFADQFSTDVFATYSFNPKFQVLVASRSNRLLNTETKQYENCNAGLVGFGYLFQKDSASNFSTLVQLMYGNTFNKSASYNEHIFDLGVNFYFYKMFYLGTGFKFFHVEETKFTELPNYNINWYCRLGFKLNFGKK